MADMASGFPPAHPVSAATTRPAPVLWTVQAMRGAAALMVVAGHAQSAVAIVVEGAGGRFERSGAVPWGAGVDLFFVISGFIMVHTAGGLFGRPHARATFLRRRLVRIVPLYWLVTIVFLALLAIATLKGGDPFPSGAAVLAAFAFLPFDTHADGRLFPIYDLGWTLNYEMFFYALLAVAIGWPRARALGALAAALLLLVAIGPLVPPGSAAWFWTRPILLDFGLGVGVGAMAATVVLPVPVRWLLAVAGMSLLLLDPTGLFAGPAGTTVANAWPRVIFAGLPVAAILAASVLGREPPRPQVARPLVALGDASYSLYLLHPFALILLEKLAQKTPIAAAMPGGVLALATIALALLIAVVGHRLVERPLTHAIARRLAPPPSSGRLHHA